MSASKPDDLPRLLKRLYRYRQAVRQPSLTRLLSRILGKQTVASHG